MATKKQKFTGILSEKRAFGSDEQYGELTPDDIFSCRNILKVWSRLISGRSRQKQSFGCEKLYASEFGHKRPHEL